MNKNNSIKSNNIVGSNNVELLLPMHHKKNMKHSSSSAFNNGECDDLVSSREDTSTKRTKFVFLYVFNLLFSSQQIINVYIVVNYFRAFIYNDALYTADKSFGLLIGDLEGGE